jgi:hypothetical protein
VGFRRVLAWLEDDGGDQVFSREKNNGDYHEEHIFGCSGCIGNGFDAAGDAGAANATAA